MSTSCRKPYATSWSSERSSASTTPRRASSSPQRPIGSLHHEQRPAGRDEVAERRPAARSRQSASRATATRRSWSRCTTTPEWSAQMSCCGRRLAPAGRGPGRRGRADGACPCRRARSAWRRAASARCGGRRARARRSRSRPARRRRRSPAPARCRPSSKLTSRIASIAWANVATKRPIAIWLGLSRRIVCTMRGENWPIASWTTTMVMVSTSAVSVTIETAIVLRIAMAASGPPVGRRRHQLVVVRAIDGDGAERQARAQQDADDGHEPEGAANVRDDAPGGHAPFHARRRRARTASACGRAPRAGNDRPMTVVGFHASHEQVHPSALLDAVQRAEAAGFTRRDVLGPLLAVERAAGPQRLRLVVARRGAGHHVAAVRHRHRARPALPPGDRRAGDRPRWPRCSPAASGRRSARGEASNEHITGDRWPRKEVRNARLRECVDVIRRAAPRRGGQPRRPRDGRPRADVDADRTSRRRCSPPRCRPRPRGGRPAGPTA